MSVACIMHTSAFRVRMEAAPTPAMIMARYDTYRSDRFTGIIRDREARKGAIGRLAGASPDPVAVRSDDPEGSDRLPDRVVRDTLFMATNDEGGVLFTMRVFRQTHGTQWVACEEKTYNRMRHFDAPAEAEAYAIAECRREANRPAPRPQAYIFGDPNGNNI